MKEYNRFIIQHYGLRFYVHDGYIKDAGERGGKTFKPNYKKDLKSFQLRVKCAVNRSANVLDLTFERFPLTYN